MTFSCSACLNRLPWTTETIGREIVCDNCQNLTIAPASAEWEGGSLILYDLAGDPSDPQPVMPAAAGSSPLLILSDNDSVLSYERHDPPPAQVLDVLEGAPLKDFYLPMGLVIFGALAVFAHSMWGANAAGTFTGVLRYIGFYVTWNLSITLVGIFIAAKVEDIGFGEISQAILKLAAIVLGPAGIESLLVWIIGGYSGEFVGFFISLGVYWWLFSYLFELDFRETFICVLLITLLKVFAFMVYGYFM